MAFTGYLVIDGGVEDGQRTERYEVHDDQVHPVDVHVHVGLVQAHGGGVQLVHVVGVVGVPALAHLDLPEPGEIVRYGEDDDGDHVAPGPAVRAQRPGLQRVADGHEPFQGDGQGQVHGHGLRDHRYGEDDGRDQRVHLVVVVEQVVGGRVDDRQPEQQYGRDDQHRVAPGQPDQQVVDGRLHLGPGQDDHRYDVAQDAEHAHHVQHDPVRHELEQQVVVGLAAVTHTVAHPAATVFELTVADSGVVDTRRRVSRPDARRRRQIRVHHHSPPSIYRQQRRYSRCRQSLRTPRYSTCKTNEYHRPQCPFTLQLIFNFFPKNMFSRCNRLQDTLLYLIWISGF